MRKNLPALLILVAVTSCISVVSPIGARADTAPMLKHQWIEELASEWGAVDQPQLAAAIQALRDGNPATAFDAASAFVKDHPDSTLGQELLGTSAFLQGRFPDAQQALMAAVKSDPKRAASYVLLGYIELKANTPKQAEPLFRQALKQQPQLNFARRGLVLTLIRLSRWQEAATEAQECLKRSAGKDDEAAYLLASINHEAGHQAEAEQLLTDVLKRRPDFQEAELLQGMVKIDLQKYQEASTLLKDILTRDPKSPWARLGMAVIWRLDGDTIRARAELEQLVQERSDWSLAYFRLGETLLEQGEEALATDTFTQAISAASDPTSVKLRVASAWLRAGQPERAIDQARRLAQEMPGTLLSIHTLLSQAYRAQGRLDLAEVELQALIGANPKNLSWVMQLGQLYLEQQRPREALTQFKKAAELDHTSLEPLIAQVEAQMALGDEKAALAAAQKVKTAEHNSPDGELFIGSVYDRLEKIKPAEERYREVLKRNPAHLGAKLALARLLIKTHRTPQALELLHEMQQSHSDSTAVLLEVAKVFEWAERFSEAETLYRQVLERDRYQPIVLNNLAFVLSRDPSKLDEALLLAQRASRLVPTSSPVADTLGWICYLKGDLAKARALITNAVTLIGHDPQLHYHLGMINLKQGDIKSARIELMKALQSPTFPGAAEAKAVLDTLK